MLDQGDVPVRVDPRPLGGVELEAPAREHAAPLRACRLGRLLAQALRYLLLDIGVLGEEELHEMDLAGLDLGLVGLDAADDRARVLVEMAVYCTTSRAQ